MRILIGGDSWALGEWGCTRCEGGSIDSDTCINNCQSFADINYGVRHKGLEQYLVDAGHHVVNAGRGGISNSSSIKLVHEALEQNDYDMVLWFETSPYRDLTEIPDTVEDLELIIQNSTKKNYLLLNDIDADVYIFGGCGKANNDILNLLDVKPCIVKESLIEWLSGDTHPNIWVGEDDIERLREIGFPVDVLVYMLSNNFTDALSNELFKPDSVHMNREGHLRLFELLQSGGYI